MSPINIWKIDLTFRFLPSLQVKTSFKLDEFGGFRGLPYQDTFIQGVISESLQKYASKFTIVKLSRNTWYLLTSWKRGSLITVFMLLIYTHRESFQDNSSHSQYFACSSIFHASREVVWFYQVIIVVSSIDVSGLKTSSSLILQGCTLVALLWWLTIWDLEAARESTAAGHAAQHYWLFKRQLKFLDSYRICKVMEAAAINDALILKYFQIDLRVKPAFLWKSIWFKLLFWARFFKNSEIELTEANF